MSTQPATQLVHDPDAAGEAEDVFEQARLGEAAEQDAAEVAADQAKALLAQAQAAKNAADRAAGRTPARGHPRLLSTPPPPETKAEKIERERLEADSVRIANFSDTTPWYVKRIGPRRDAKGRKVDLGIYPEIQVGKCDVDILSDLVGGGVVQVLLGGDPRESTAQWSDPIKLMGEPKRDISVYGPDALGEPGQPVAPVDDDEWVDDYDPMRGPIKVRRADRDASQRNQISPVVAAQLEAMKASQASMEKILTALAAPKTDETMVQMMEMERLRAESEKERLQAESERLRQEAKEERVQREADRKEAAEIRRQEHEAAMEARKQEHESATEARRQEREDARLEREAADARHRESLAAIEARLAEERQSNREAQQHFQEMLAVKDERPDPLETITSTIEAMKGLSELTGGGAATGGEGGGEWWHGPAGEALKGLPDILARFLPGQQQQQPVKQIAQRRAPAPQQQQPEVGFEGEDQPAEEQPAAEEQAPQNGNGNSNGNGTHASEVKEVPMNEAVAQFLTGVTEHMDASRPASILADEFAASMPDFAKQVAAYKSADVMLAEIEKIPTYAGFEGTAAVVKGVQDRVKAGKKPYLSDFLASLRRKIKA